MINDSGRRHPRTLLGSEPLTGRQIRSYRACVAAFVVVLVAGAVFGSVTGQQLWQFVVVGGLAGAFGVRLTQLKRHHWRQLVSGRSASG